MLGFSHFYRLNTLILGQFPCFSGIFHIKPFDRPIFLNYPENLQGTFVMAEFISDYFTPNFETAGAFDAVMDSGSHYFINVTRLKDTKTPEFSESYKKMNSKCYRH